MIYPSKPKPGDRVAILSPSAGLPGAYPEVYELGLRRLVDELALAPVEYPTTRRMGASAADRAADIHTAFADPTITSVMASIGGDDQITYSGILMLIFSGPTRSRSSATPITPISTTTCGILAWSATTAAR